MSIDFDDPMTNTDAASFSDTSTKETADLSSTKMEGWKTVFHAKKTYDAVLHTETQLRKREEDR